ncbi:MAG: extracellular solute-binding protein, partial [Clostridiales bacterium]|nr:extracellular solute-binding protein [Clostridiales bacterium]
MGMLAAAALALGIAGGAMASSFDAANEIAVVSREGGSGTRGAFIELMGIEVKDEEGNKTDRTTDEATIANSTSIVLAIVTGNRYAIGYISLGSLNDTVKALPVDGVAPSAEAVKDGSYAIARPFNIVARDEQSDAAKDFIAFILSAEGQQVVADNNYIRVAEDAAGYAVSGLTGKITVAGSSSVTPVMEKLKEAYVALNPGVEIEIQMSDSTTGVQN